MEEQAEPSIAEEFGGNLRKKRKRQATAPMKKNNAESSVAPDEDNLGGSTEDCNSPGVRVSVFDYSVENHFRAVDTISKLCGEDEDDPIEESEIARLSSAITFLREWRHFNYEPRIIRFACEMGSPQGKDVVTGINLAQFSSATVPKQGELSGGTTSPPSSPPSPSGDSYWFFEFI